MVTCDRRVFQHNDSSAFANILIHGIMLGEEEMIGVPLNESIVVACNLSLAPTS